MWNWDSNPSRAPNIFEQSRFTLSTVSVKYAVIDHPARQCTTTYCASVMHLPQLTSACNKRNLSSTRTPEGKATFYDNENCNVWSMTVSSELEPCSHTASQNKLIYNFSSRRIFCRPIYFFAGPLILEISDKLFASSTIMCCTVFDTLAGPL